MAALATVTPPAVAADLGGKSTVAEWRAASREERLRFSSAAGKIAFPAREPVVAGALMHDCLETVLAEPGIDSRSMAAAAAVCTIAVDAGGR